MFAAIVAATLGAIVGRLTSSVTLSASTAVVVYVVLAFATTRSKDPYGSFHLSLNATDSDAGKPPSTEWLNMGYWKDAKTFPEACEALALKTIDAAACKAGGCVLDVGHGSGDSLLLQLQHPSVPRPSELVGITSLKEHYQRSLERTNDVSSPTDVILYHGDAVHHTSDSDSSQAKHPLDPSTSSKRYTSIVAIDCAYHFRTRTRFLRRAFACLAPGGRIALADLCFEDGVGGSTWTRKLLALLGVMPAENMVTKAEYVRTMENLGFEDVRMEDITGHVFPGFATFLSQHGFAWRLFAQVLLSFSSAGLRFVVVSGRR